MTSSYFPSRLEGYFDDASRRRFTLTKDFIYTDEEKDIRVVVPQGFTTDWNSTPRAIWAYFAPWEYPEAGLVHDWLYASPSGFTRLSRNGPLANHMTLSKADCDDVHRRILDLSGCRWTKRQIIYTALRAGGGFAWERHRAEDGKPPQPVVVMPEATTTELQSSPNLIVDVSCKESDAPTE